MSEKLQRFIQNTKFYKETKKVWLEGRKIIRFDHELKGAKLYSFTTFCICVSAGCLWLLYKKHQVDEEKQEVLIKRRSSENIFLKFASVEYKGQALMTPLDFIDSVLNLHTRIRRARRAIVSEKIISEIKSKTPTVKDDSVYLFSRLKNLGIITYSEFLFLLTILTKPYSAFETTFKMLDTDFSGTVDRKEYLIMERILSQAFRLRQCLCLAKTKDQTVEVKLDDEYFDDEAGLQKKQHIDTTILLHFFGEDGSQVLSLESFTKFLLNVQSEILELEFVQFSHGLPYITEIDFAKLLLRYTYFDDDYEYDDLIDRILAKSKDQDIPEGINFEDYKSFIHFLHTLEEFHFIIRYSESVKSKVSRSEFHDAFKLLRNHQLSFHVIDTVFDIFDIDNSGYIIYKEFIHVMNERLHRGFKRYSPQSVWGDFKRCIRRNMKHDTRS